MKSAKSSYTLNMSPSRLKKRLSAILLVSTIIIMGIGFFLADTLLIRHDKYPNQVDALVVIGGDHKPERINQTIDLFNRGIAPIVIISAGTYVYEGNEYLHEAEVMRRQAEALGLPSDVIVIENESFSTFENAIKTKSILASLNANSIILITSPYHSRRANRIFSDELEPEIEVWAAPSQLKDESYPWWLNSDQNQVVFYEYYNWVDYWLGTYSSQ